MNAATTIAALAVNRLKRVALPNVRGCGGRFRFTSMLILLGVDSTRPDSTESTTSIEFLNIGLRLVHRTILFRRTQWIWRGGRATLYALPALRIFNSAGV
jgi:hypothetical protein